jgi:hypothetical protein
MRRQQRTVGGVNPYNTYLRPMAGDRKSYVRHEPNPGGSCLKWPYNGRGKMRGILLWLLGIPIPIIILLYLFHVI